MRPTFSRFRGGLHVGADFFARRGAVLTTGERPRGVVDRVEDLANPALDPRSVHPAAAAFFEDTTGLTLHVRSRW